MNRYTLGAHEGNRYLDNFILCHKNYKAYGDRKTIKVEECREGSSAAVTGLLKELVTGLRGTITLTELS